MRALDDPHISGLCLTLWEEAQQGVWGEGGGPRASWGQIGFETPLGFP